MALKIFLASFNKPCILLLEVNINKELSTFEHQILDANEMRFITLRYRVVRFH
jgi:hypothetical protein